MQVRYFLSAPRHAADSAYARIEAAFEEEGAPLSLVEIDEAKGIWEVSAYVDAGDGEDRSAEYAAAAGLGPDVAIGREDLPDQDWMASVLAGLKPVRAGRFVVHGAHDRANVGAHELAIEIEAGMAFGTGHHGTTAGCLTLIDDVVRLRRPRQVLDLGTGSAVLAIAVAKLARLDVLATDIDPVAVKVAAENVRANGVAARVETAQATGFASPQVRRRAPYDLIVANILAGPLISLSGEFRRHAAPRADVILSGILTGQAAAVRAAFRAQGFVHCRTLVRGEWVALHLRRMAA
ncbi:50S ribosomal protein L11 methyltransferase [Aurantimonas sp. 22II-16-19i]|uniref:50S ribosomal protein L11 methyltransferase n=1 Tax=Aurantimonas sp. 22II-16-19i TaxID=1317114 RepID=UPI0009F7F30E|nr:50S ribosomal protein L11 methyltransferase [Aurantimonas sp. 22II-16-19i]ORE98324.1 ribosomal protein L11 methyltransferase [Aurantimonas sp. 22II-16-19i]